MAQVGVAQFISFFSISLVFSSILISWVFLNAYGANVVGLEFPNYEESNAHDFTQSWNNSETESMHGVWDFNQGIGLTPTNTNSYILTEDGRVGIDGTVTNEYEIYNPNQEEFSVVFSYSGERINEIVIAEDGFHVLRNSWSNIFLGDDLYFVPYSGATSLTNVKIKTIYNNAIQAQEDTALTLYVNDQIVMEMPSEFNYKSDELASRTFYGGIGNRNNMGIVLKSISTSNSKSDVAVTAWYDSILLWLKTVMTIIVWNVPDEYFPWELNMLLIKSQAFCILVGLAVLARG